MNGNHQNILMVDHALNPIVNFWNYIWEANLPQLKLDLVGDMQKSLLLEEVALVAQIWMYSMVGKIVLDIMKSC